VRSSSRDEEGHHDRSDVVAGGFMFVFAVAYLAAAFTIPEPSFENTVVGPKAVPLAIGVVLAVASLALAIRGFFKGSSERDAGPGAPGEDAPPQDLRKLGVVVLLLLAYILIFVPLGYAISTSLFMLSTTMYLDREHWVRNLVYAIVFSVVVYSIFVYVFGVQLPAGILGSGI
jgi:putative tricarboxylic transport membrane protein